MIAIESEERPWGRFFVLHDQPSYKLKRIEVDPGGRLSYQYHHKRSEAWTIVEGVGTITLDGEIKDYSKGETVLERMGDVDQIILVGDYAKGNDSGLIEVFLIGQALNMDYIAQLEDKIEDLIGRKVSFYLASKFLADREHIVLFNSKDK